MRMGVHQSELAESLKGADARYLLQPSGLGWSLDAVFAKSEVQAFIADNTADLVSHVASEAQAGDSILVMSNGFFDGIHQKLLDALAQKG
jgi:UDP-N-acetylmuramate: L-alanyl-gamma-D-glutamyl-meso-diaminopimelate ligase